MTKLLPNACIIDDAISFKQTTPLVLPHHPFRNNIYPLFPARDRFAIGSQWCARTGPTTVPEQRTRDRIVYVPSVKIE